MKTVLTKIQSLILLIILSGFSTPSYALPKRNDLKIDASIYLAKAMCMSIYIDIKGNTYNSKKKIGDLAYNIYKKQNELLTRRIFNNRVVQKTAVQLFARHVSPKSQCIDTMFSSRNKSDRKAIKELKNYY